MAHDLPSIHIPFNHELRSVDVAKALDLNNWVCVKIISQLNGQNSDKGGRNFPLPLHYRFSVSDLQGFF